MHQGHIHNRPQIKTGGARSPRIRFRLRNGSLLLEAIVAIGVFGIFLAGIGLALVLGERSTMAGGDRARGATLAEQQLEALRQMRLTGFSSLTTGQHGLMLGAKGWTFTGTSVLSDGYRRSVNITSLATDRLRVESQVTWNFGNTRSGTIVLESTLTNWRKKSTVGNWGSMTRIANVTPGSTPEFQKIAVSGNYAYITSSQSSGGKGLYIYDVSVPSSPVRVSSSFDLGASAYGLAVVGNRLYLTTSSSTSEVQVYDVSSPASLASGNLVNSYDLAGSGLARSIAVYGAHVFVGTVYDTLNPEFTAIQMSETGPMTLLDTLSLSGSALDISLHDGYAYVANDANSAEFQVVDIFDPEDLAFASGVGIDLTDTQNGSAIAAFGTSALIGRLNGSTIDELTLYDIASAPVPSPPPGPWTLEIGGNISDIAVIDGSKYAFVGGSASSAQVKVIDTAKFAGGLTPVLLSYNAGATVNGVTYDFEDDRMYAITDTHLMVFAPG